MNFYVSPHGLVSCPDCKTHFRPDGDPWDAEWRHNASCPHCETRLGRSSGRSVLSRIRSSGRAGLVAAALFGLTATGCSGPQEKPTPPQKESDVTEDPDANETPDARPNPEAAPEAAPQPEIVVPVYGEAPDRR